MITRVTSAVALTLGLLVGCLTVLWPAGRSPVGAATAPTTDVRLVAGSAAVTDRLGQLWSPDAPYAIGGRLNSTSSTIAGTTDPALYRGQRFGLTGYSIPVPAGSYTLTLGLAEQYWTKPGQRVFDIAAQGSGLASGVDLVAAVGPLHAQQLSYPVTVTGSSLELRFTSRVDLAEVRTVRVTSASAAPATTRTVRPEDFGAVGNGMTDDTVALQQAFDAGGTVALATGKVYAHSAVLHVRVAGERISGLATLLATREATSSVWIEADHVTLAGVTLKMSATTQRWSAWEQMGLRLVGHTGITLNRVTVIGSAAAGIYLGDQTSAFVLDHVVVRDTRADGIHMTAGSHNGRVLSPSVSNTGDDGIAVVSYSADGAACHDITVSSPTVDGTTGGRGLSIVGGTNITETGIIVRASAAAGVYIASEGSPWFTAAPQNVRITSGTITGANTDIGIDHGAVLVLAGETGPAPTSITITGLTITDTRATASRVFGVVTYGTPPSEVLFSNLTITGGPANAYGGNTPQASFRTRSITQNGRVLTDLG